MSESDHLLAAIECCGARAKIAQGKLDQFTPMPSDASSERTYRKLKEDWREATEHAEHLRRRLGRFDLPKLTRWMCWRRPQEPEFSHERSHPTFLRMRG
jgi:hypothetical protein